MYPVIAEFPFDAGATNDTDAFVPATATDTVVGAPGTAYTGTLANFGSAKNNFANGVGTFAPSGTGQSKTYHVSYTVNAGTPDAQQGASAAATFTWEANS